MGPGETLTEEWKEETLSSTSAYFTISYSGTFDLVIWSSPLDSAICFKLPIQHPPLCLLMAGGWTPPPLPRVVDKAGGAA